MRSFCIILLVLLVPQHRYTRSRASIQIDCSDGAQFIVQDQLGRKRGSDPRGVPKDTGYGTTFYRQIPGANYAFAGMGDDGNPMEFICRPINHNFNGKNPIDFIGLATRNISVTIFADVDSAAKSFHYRHVFAFPIEKDSVVSFYFHFNDTDTSQIGVEKVVSTLSLLRDIQAMQHLNWITSISLADSLRSTTKALGAANSTADYFASKSALNTLLALISANKGRSLKAEGYISLKADIDTLLARMPSSSHD